MLAVEKLSPTILPNAHGSAGYSDSRNTIKVLQYIANRFGPVASFTGTYRATSWRLNIHRRSADLGMFIHIASVLWYWRLHVIMFLDSVFTLKPGHAKLISILCTGCVSVTPPPTVSTPLPTSTVAPANCTEPSSPQGEHQQVSLNFSACLYDYAFVLSCNV